MTFRLKIDDIVLDKMKIIDDYDRKKLYYDKKMPPLLVYRYQDRWHLADGYHRIEILKKMGRKTALVRKIE